jgi:hypothetical protein
LQDLSAEIEGAVVALIDYFHKEAIKAFADDNVSGSRRHFVINGKGLYGSIPRIDRKFKRTIRKEERIKISKRLD